jgi:hypothetical protein
LKPPLILSSWRGYRPIAIGLSLRRFQYTQAIFSDKADCCHGRIVLKINSERLAVFGIVRRPRPL